MSWLSTRRRKKRTKELAQEVVDVLSEHDRALVQLKEFNDTEHLKEVMVMAGKIKGGEIRANVFQDVVILYDDGAHEDMYNDDWMYK